MVKTIKGKAAVNIDFETRPLTPEAWVDFEAVMGPQGACYGCWCTHFRMAPKERREAHPDDRKAFMKQLVVSGPPPGLLGYLDGKPVGWVQVCPRSNVPRWNTPRTVSRPLDDHDADDPAVWAISCFFLKSGFRGRGLSHLLLSGAVDFAVANGARVVDACPIEKTKQPKSVGLYVGPLNVFEKYGFKTVAQRKEGRPLMRYEAG